MRVLYVLAIIAAAGFARHVWHGHAQRHAELAMAQAQAQPSPNGFVATAMPEGAAADTVLVLAPVNCPSQAARRADALARKLTEMHIPNQRSNRFALRVSNPTPEQRNAMQSATDVLRGEIPAVFINGMGKSNPTAEEVVAEYERTGARN
jgi:hypothetical protein